MKIRAARKEHIEAVIDFVLPIRREVFPMLDHSHVPRDLQAFEHIYIHAQRSSFLLAHDEKGTIVGCIGVVPYDGRFQDLSEASELNNSAEIVKCYVNPQIRRKGVGKKLVQQAILFCKEQQYTTAYLHTHRFLPGAVNFWDSLGFHMIKEDHDEMETVHMARIVL
ncbi:MAG TPA: GNAT family N-acetyltransferase [Candidatus Bathyarchaeia archaeon]|nr:GNAT family N-acetyltransferase [Candidatus Bathyarchaeia archaeon]